MQIAAAKPEYLDREAVPADRVEKEMEILKVQAMNEGKPAEIAEKMVQGRIGKFARFEKGEGIEKKEENFAEEVMNQLK